MGLQCNGFSREYILLNTTNQTIADKQGYENWRLWL